MKPISKYEIVYEYRLYKISVTKEGQGVETIVYNNNNEIITDHWIIYRVIQEFETKYNCFLEELQFDKHNTCKLFGIV